MNDLQFLRRGPVTVRLLLVLGLLMAGSSAAYAAVAEETAFVGGDEA